MEYAQPQKSVLYAPLHLVIMMAFIASYAQQAKQKRQPPTFVCNASADPLSTAFAIKNTFLQKKVLTKQTFNDIIRKHDKKYEFFWI